MIAQQILSPNTLRCAPKHSIALIERELARTYGPSARPAFPWFESYHAASASL
jgi:hypothetical protein